MISLILPTRKRPERLKTLLENIYSTTDSRFELILILDSDDKESQDLAYQFAGGRKIIIESRPENTSVEKWNLGAKHSTYDWLFLASDDFILPANWASRVLSTSNTGFIAVPDQQNPKGLGFSPFYAARKDWLKKFNGGVFAIPVYKAWGIDVEICERAILTGQYSVADVIIQHNHPVWGLGEKDETFRRGQVNWNSDLALLSKRRKLNYPNDFEGYL